MEGQVAVARRALEPPEFPYFDYRRLTFSLGIVSRGAAWLSGSTAARFDPATRAMVVEGDLAAQATVILDKMRIALAAGGLALHDITRMVQYLTPSCLAALGTLMPLYRERFPAGLPSLCTVAVKSLLRPSALIEIEALAGPTRLEYLTATGPDLRQARERAEELLRSRGMSEKATGRRLELITPSVIGDGSAAGLQIIMPRLLGDEAAQIQMTAVRGDASKVRFAWAQGDPGAGDVMLQCREVYERIARQLAAVGASMDEVVKTTEFVAPAGLAAYRQTAEVRRAVFGAPYPAATGVVCEGLPRPGAQIAVEAVAVLSQ